MTMTDMEVDLALLHKAVNFLLDQGATIELIGSPEVPAFEIEGEAVFASQVILKAYAAGMAEAQ